MSIQVLILFAILAAAIVYFINIPGHIKRTDKFYDSIDEMIDNYYKIYPNDDPFYFYDLVKPEIVTMWQPWVTDYNKFIINTEKLKELFEGNKRFLESEKNSQALYCPWCENNDIEFFQYHPLDKKVIEKGIVVCLKCRATTPPGILKEGIFILNEKYKQEIDEKI